MPPPVPVTPTQPLTQRPVVALYTVDPWARVLGADVPTTVIYADGDAIIVRPPAAEGQRGRLVEGKVPEPSAFFEKLREALSDIPVHTTLWGATDQPTTLILMDLGDGWIRRSVYGPLTNCRSSRAETMQPLPEGFEQACRLLSNLKLDDEHDYVPEWTEVMLTPYEKSPEPPLPWPAEVPAPPDVTPQKFGVVRHLVKSSAVGPLTALVASLKPRQAVLLHDKKWAVSWRRPPPGDAYLSEVKRATATQR